MLRLLCMLWALSSHLMCLVCMFYVPVAAVSMFRLSIVIVRRCRLVAALRPTCSMQSPHPCHRCWTSLGCCAPATAATWAGACAG